MPGQGRGSPHGLSLCFGAAPAFGGVGADQVPFDIRQPAENRQHQAPVPVPVSAHGSASERNCALPSHDALDDAKEVEGAARKSVNPRHRHHIAGGQPAEHPVKLAPVCPRTGHLLLVDVPAVASGLAKLLKLTVEGLPVGRDASIADEPFFGIAAVSDRS